VQLGADRLRLPPHRLGHLRDGCTIGTVKHLDKPGLLRSGATCTPNRGGLLTYLLAQRLAPHLGGGAATLAFCWAHVRGAAAHRRALRHRGKVRAGPRPVEPSASSVRVRGEFPRGHQSHLLLLPARALDLKMQSAECNDTNGLSQRSEALKTHSKISYHINT
jgi:hypothetical protein